MTKSFHLPILFLSLISVCNSQSQTIEIKEKKHSNNEYKDFIYDDTKIWGLTTDGKLSLFDLNTGDAYEYTANNDSAIVVIAKDKNGSIIIGDKSNAIKKFDRQTNSWITLFKFDNTLLGITFDSKNNYYLITNKGIYDCLIKKYFYPDKSQNPQISYKMGWLKSPAFLTDRNDNIWIGFGYGEWGGSLFIFDTKTKAFIIPELKDFVIELNPIKSIFEGDKNVYVTAGLMHFSTSGSIVQFKNFHAKVIFASEEQKKFPNDSTNYETIAGEYIGPGTFNEKDSCLYFYSQNGIFKGTLKNDLSKIENWTIILQPKLHWKSGQPDAIGFPMNVLKLKFIDSNKLVFLSQNDGIGIYDGKTLIMAQ